MFLLISYWTQAPSRVGSHAQTLSRVFQVTDPVPPKAAGRGVWEQFCLWSVVGEGGGELKTELTQHPPCQDMSTEVQWDSCEPGLGGCCGAPFAGLLALPSSLPSSSPQSRNDEI